MREWLSWWSTTLPRSGSRVRVPSRALFYFKGLVFTRLFLVNEYYNPENKRCRPILQADIFVLITSKHRIIQIVFLSYFFHRIFIFFIIVLTFKIIHIWNYNGGIAVTM